MKLFEAKKEEVRKLKEKIEVLTKYWRALQAAGTRRGEMSEEDNGPEEEGEQISEEEEIEVEQPEGREDNSSSTNSEEIECIDLSKFPPNSGFFKQSSGILNLQSSKMIRFVYST